MQTTLPATQHTEVIAAYRSQATGIECFCGAMKRAGTPLCDGCAELVRLAGFGHWLHPVSFYAANNIPLFDSRWWHHYEALTDVAHALRTGLWDGKRTRRSASE